MGVGLRYVTVLARAAPKQQQHRQHLRNRTRYLTCLTFAGT